MYNIENIDVIWMRYAIVLAGFANLFEEVSVGAVLVYNGSIIGYGFNSSIMCNDPTAHAEILALRMGGEFLGNYRLLKTTLYVTLEPCIMCLGALIHARIFRLVYGAFNSQVKYRVLLTTIFRYFLINRRIFLTTGILEKECASLLNNFFKRKRK